jgi:tetratricopeptide (TPR) repeat protein
MRMGKDYEGLDAPVRAILASKDPPRAKLEKLLDLAEETFDRHVDFPLVLEAAGMLGGAGSDPQVARLRAHQALQRYHDREYAEAVKAFQALVADFDGKPGTAVAVFVAQEHLGRLMNSGHMPADGDDPMPQIAGFFRKAFALFREIPDGGRLFWNTAHTLANDGDRILTPEEVADILRRLIGHYAKAGRDREAARTKQHLASHLIHRMEDPPAAIPLLEEALATFERLYGRDRPDCDNDRRQLAEAYWKAGRPEDALRVAGSVSADAGPHSAELQHASWLEADEKWGEAADVYRKLIDHLEETDAPGHTAFNAAAFSLAGYLEDTQGDAKGARQVYLRLARHYARHHGDAALEFEDLRSLLGAFGKLSEGGFPPDFCDTAITTLNAVLPRVKESFEVNPPWASELPLLLAKAMAGRGDIAGALATLERCLADEERRQLNPEVAEMYDDALRQEIKRLKGKRPRKS